MKRLYKKPEMEIIEGTLAGTLLSGSDPATGSAEKNPWGEGGVIPTEEKEEAKKALPPKSSPTEVADTTAIIWRYSAWE